MDIQRLTNLLAGSDDLPKIHRIYNTVCFIAILFCSLAAIESALASLNPILIANNVFYSLVLAFLFYLSRVKRKFGASRFLGIAVLLFIYTPILWIYNGGSASGIPYYILLFCSFLTILTVTDISTRRNNIYSWIILITYSLIICGLILLEFIRPDIFYVYSDPTTRAIDMIVSVLSALAGNFFILRAFIREYYKNLAQIQEYSKRLEELVVRDSMTNLYNHGFIVSRLSDEVDKAARYLRPLSILMIDIDHFKKINDTYGHTFGDEVLIKLAQAIQSSCRTVDVIARYGGEEFLIVLPETNSVSASVAARRLQRIIQNLTFSHEMTVTVSGGIVQYRSGDTSTKMVERADALLYEAKSEGRNRIKVEPEGEKDN